MNAGMLYGQLLERPAPVRVRDDDGCVQPVPLNRWLSAATDVEDRLADAVEGPVLDVGCGPGRVLDALTCRGISALGVDLSPSAVAVARRRGRPAILGDVFGPLPGAGLWNTALLLDGNVGIGGDPGALLRRLRSLLAPGGSIVTEVEPPGARSRTGRSRLEAAGAVSHWFPWARVGADDVPALAAAGRLAVGDLARFGDRWFAWLA